MNKKQIQAAKNILGALGFLAAEADRTGLTHVSRSLIKSAAFCHQVLEQATGEKAFEPHADNDFLMAVKFLAEFVSINDCEARRDVINNLSIGKSDNPSHKAHF